MSSNSYNLICINTNTTETQLYSFMHTHSYILEVPTQLKHTHKHPIHIHTKNTQTCQCIHVFHSSTLKCACNIKVIFIPRVLKNPRFFTLLIINTTIHKYVHSPPTTYIIHMKSYIQIPTCHLHTPLTHYTPPPPTTPPH